MVRFIPWGESDFLFCHSFPSFLYKIGLILWEYTKILLNK